MNRGARRADVHAFRALYEDHYGFVWSTVARMGVSPDAIDDAVQDSFLVAYRRWDDLPRERRRAWLYGIARRVSSNARRLERRRRRKHDAVGRVRSGVVEVEGRFEASRLLNGFVGELDPGDRELFVLGVVEGLTGRELSCALAAPPSTVHGRLQALRSRFRDQLGDEAGTTIARARRARPRASEASWALLMLPKLAPGVAFLGPILVAAAAAAVIGIGVSSSDAPDDAVGNEDAERASFVAVEQPTPRVKRSSALETRASASPPHSPVATSRPRAFDSSATKPRRSQIPDPLQMESVLVRDLRAAVKAGEHVLALRLVDRHEREFPTGVLEDAVVALHVEALCASGDLQRAQAQARAFLREHPSTPVARRLSRGCPAPVIQKPQGSGERREP